MYNIFDMELVSDVDILFNNFKIIWKNGSLKNKKNLQNVKTTDSVSLCLFYSGEQMGNNTTITPPSTDLFCFIQRSLTTRIRKNAIITRRSFKNSTNSKSHNE